MTRALTILAMAALILTFVPTTTIGGEGSAEPQAHDPPACVTQTDPGPDGEWEWRRQEIILPTYAADELPVTTLSWAFLFNDGSDLEDGVLEGPINGLDAYIIDLGCETAGLVYCLTGFDSGVDSYDLQVTFRDDAFDVIEGPVNPADSRDVCGDDTETLDQVLPTDTRFVEIVTVDGTPGACGCLDSDTFLPASVQVTFLLTR